MGRRILLVLLVLSAISTLAAVLWRYNTYVYHRALREAPVPVRQVIKKVVEIPLKYKLELVKWFPFSQERELREWEEKVFKGKVVYYLEQDDDLSYVRAKSEGKASALYYKVKLSTRGEEPVISWKWRVNTFPTKTQPETLDAEDELDFAARVYVIFPVGFITNWKVLEYVWAEELPAGTTGTSPYSKNIKIMVLRSGPSDEGQWYTEERSIVEDYATLFGSPPRHAAGAVAFMTNAEHTGTSADAMYDEIRIGYADDTEEESGGTTRAD